MSLTMAIAVYSALASEIKADGVDSGAEAPTLLVKAHEARMPSGIPEDVSGIAMSNDGSFWAVCDSRGETLVQCPANEVSVCTVDLDFEALATVRSRFHVLDDRD